MDKFNGEAMICSYRFPLNLSITSNTVSALVGEEKVAMPFAKLELTKLANRLNKPKDKVKIELLQCPKFLWDVIFTNFATRVGFAKIYSRNSTWADIKWLPL